MTYELLHPSDPAAPRELWHYVYVHGAAEVFNGRHAAEQGWHWAASDLCCCRQPIPAHGVYAGTLYGRPVTIVIAPHMGHTGGRVALTTGDPDGLEHALNPERWG